MPPTPISAGPFMTWTPDQIRAACDQVRVMPDLRPNQPRPGDTHCNSNAYRVATALGLDLFYDPKKKRILLANEMFSYMATPGCGFQSFTVTFDAEKKEVRTPITHREAWEAANAGRLVFAAQANASGHGHIAPVYPSRGMVLSGHWGVQCPYVSNVGPTVGVMGANYAFRTPPTYFIYQS